MTDPDPTADATRGSRVRRVAKRVARWSAFSLAAFLGVGLLYLGVAAVLTWIPVNRDFEPDPDGVVIYIESNGVHVDLVVPVVTDTIDWRTVIPVDPFGRHLKRYVSFGWGDRDFFINTPTWSDLTVGTAVSAVFLPSRTAMHVEYDYAAPRLGDRAREVRISAERYPDLVEHIRSGFKLDGEGEAILIDHPGYDPGYDRFYEGAGSYSLWTTCNNWTNAGLKAAGVKTATWAPFEPCVFYHRPDPP